MAVVAALVVLVLLVVPPPLRLVLAVSDFRFKLHQMDPTFTMLVVAVVVPGHQEHLLMVVMVD